MARAFRTKRMLHYFLMVVLSISATLFLSEVLLRYSGVVSVKSIHTASEQEARRIPGVIGPGQDAIVRYHPQLPHHVSINSLGYRGREISRTKNPEIVRILCVGDSFTYGWHVNNEETFPFYLEELFRRHQISVEVINAGVAGTTIVDHLYFLQRSIEMNPDLVILTFTENDIQDLAKREPVYMEIIRRGKLKSRPLFRTAYSLFRDTALVNFLLMLRKNYAKHFERLNGSTWRKRSLEDTHRGEEVLWRVYEEQLRTMQIYLGNRSVQFVFAIFPSHYQFVDNAEASTYRLDPIEKLAKRLSIPRINLLEPLKSANPGRNHLYLLPYDGHPSKVAYSVAANAIFEFLEANFPVMFKKKSKQR